MAKKTKITVLFLSLLLSVLLNADEVRVNALDFWQTASSWEEPLSVNQLISASLVSSGLTVEETVTYEKILRNNIEMLEEHLDGLDDESMAEEILMWMHEHILTGHYRTDQTKMDVLLNRGDYNCVSSSLLYLILTRSAGLDSRGEETVDHAFCTVAWPSGQTVDVETTTTLGYDPGSRKEFGETFKGRTGFAYVEPGDYRNRKASGDKKMITLVLQNRIAILQKQGRYGEAVGPAVDRWFFLPEDQHRKDMNDAFRNRVSQLNRRNEFTRALEFLVPLSRELDLIEENRDLIETLIANEVISQINRGETERADGFLELWKADVRDDQLGSLISMIDAKRVELIVEEGPYSRALAQVREFRDQERIGRGRAEELITWLHQNEAIRIMNSYSGSSAEKSLEAYSFLLDLPEEEGYLPGITDHRNRYLNNWAVSVHNSFVPLANRGEYAAARRLLEDALKIDEDNALLLNDMKILDQRQ